MPATNFPSAQPITAINTNNTSVTNTYMSLDITKYYWALYSKKTELQNQNVVKNKSNQYEH